VHKRCSCERSTQMITRQLAVSRGGICCNRERLALRGREPAQTIRAVVDTVRLSADKLQLLGLLYEKALASPGFANKHKVTMSRLGKRNPCQFKTVERLIDAIEGGLTRIGLSDEEARAVDSVRAELREARIQHNATHHKPVQEAIAMARSVRGELIEMG